jgi:hypothetical protein
MCFISEPVSFLELEKLSAYLTPQVYEEKHLLGSSLAEEKVR